MATKTGLLKVTIFLFALLLASTVSAQAGSDGWNPAGITGGESVAIQTFTHSEYANGAVRLEFDWRDNTGEVIRFRCANNGTAALWGGVYEVDPVTGAETQLWTGTCQPGQTVTFPVSRFNLQWDTVDGGLIMGNYQIRTRYPA